MKKHLLTIVLLTLFCQQIFSQTSVDTTTQLEINNYYKLALLYKDGSKGVSIDFNQSYNYFFKAALLGDPQSIYAVAYMKYKGLGCIQNYDTAATLFAQGAAQGRDNSLYFYGLCWRNGYGVPQNADSAKYYIQKSADLGYKQALLELATSTSENSNDSAAQVLLSQINNAAIPDNNVLNQFTRIEPHLPSSEIITGDYKGWLIQYDWSGKHMVVTTKLELNLKADNNDLTGEWKEMRSDSIDSVKIKARIVSDTIVFSQTQNTRKDHYSPNLAISYNFQNAKLNILQQEDSIYIAGNIEMFSPYRGEPSKPIFVILSRPALKQLENVDLQLTAFPNPFNSQINAQFNLPKAASVSVQLYNINGELKYTNEAGILQKGYYSLTISNNNLASGMYILKLTYGNQIKTLKVIKQ
jgi:hypothetical protein